MGAKTVTATIANTTTSTTNTKFYNFPSRDNFNLKLYKFDLFKYKYTDLIFDQYYHSLYEKIDLNDLKHASIIELILSSSIPLTNISKFEICELLKNSNIKRLIIKILPQINLSINKFLIYISKLISNNTFIEEIELHCDFKYRYTNIEKQTWKLFLTTINNRLVSLNFSSELSKEDFFNKQLFNNSNLKEINILSRTKDLLSSEYTEVIKYIFSSIQYLEEFTINQDINIKIFEDFINLKKVTSINTLILNNTSLKSNIAIIKYAHKFKIESLIIKFNDMYDTNHSCAIDDLEKSTLDHLFLLSINPFNTVKRIVIMNKNRKLKEIISNLFISNNEYNLDKIPKLFIEYYKEVIFNRNRNDSINNHSDVGYISIRNGNSNTSNKFTILYENKEFKYYYRFKLTVKENLIDENKFLECLYLFLNNPASFRILEIEYDATEVSEKILNQRSALQNTSYIIKQIKEIYMKFKANNIYTRRVSIKDARFDFNAITPELNILYFTILEIMIDMKISIDKLELINCSVLDLSNFMKDNKKLKSLNINDIYIQCEEVDKDSIYKLLEYYYLIEGKIHLKFSNCKEVEKTSVQEEYINLVYSKNRNIINFIEFSFDMFFDYYNSDQKCIPTNVNKSIINYITNTYMIQILFNYDIHYCFRNMKETMVYPINIDIKQMFNLFSLYKKYQYILDKIFFLELHNIKRDYVRKINIISLETVLDIKYREAFAYSFKYTINTKFNKKCRRYLELHRIW